MLNAKNNFMKISIITPTYNSAATIARTIDSVLEQDYTDLEYIIVDGASTDKTQEIILSYQDKIDIKFISEPDQGIYDAMNKGVKLATGEIVGILNSDDVFDNAKILSKVAESFTGLEVEGIYGDIKYFADDINKVTRYWFSGYYQEAKLNSGWIIPHPALFLLRSVYDKCGFFRTDFKIAGDYEFILRLLKIYHLNLKYISTVLVRMYDGGVSGSSLEQRKKGWAELKLAWQVNNLKVPPFFILRRVLSKISQLVIK